MNKMTINGVPYLWQPLSYTSPDGQRGFSILVAFPENNPKAEPLYLIVNNGENPLGDMSWANWIPTKDVHFSPAKRGEEVTWNEKGN